MSSKVTQIRSDIARGGVTLTGFSRSNRGTPYRVGEIYVRSEGVSKAAFRIAREAAIKKLLAGRV